jgi:hypothetical protein
VTKRLEELQIPYAVGGGMALNAHGYERATTDVDLVVTGDGLAEFKARSLGLGWLEVFPGSRGVRETDNRVKIDFLITGGNPGDGRPCGVTFPDPVAAAIEIEGARFVSLAKLIEMKLACGLSAPDRPRDFDDVIQLIRCNRLGEHLTSELHSYVHAKYRDLWAFAQRPTTLPE